MTLLVPWLQRRWLARGFHALMDRAGAIMTFGLQDGGLRSIGVLCGALQEDKLGAFLGLKQAVCRQSIRAAGKSINMMAAIPQSLSGSKMQHDTCSLQVGSRAAAVVASVAVLKLQNCLRHIIASSPSWNAL